MHTSAADLADLDRALAREWLLADGAGGYASATVLGCPTRRYHGLWVPALRPPVDRRVVLSHIDEHLRTGGAEAWLSTTEYAAGFYPDGSPAARAFDLDPLPRLASEAGGARVEREVLLLRDGAGVCVTYRVSAPADWTLDLAPMLALRPMHHLARRRDGVRVEPLDAVPGFRVLSEGMPGVFLWAEGAGARADVKPTWYEGVLVRIERERGFDFTEDLLAPGRWTVRGRGPAEFHVRCAFDPPPGPDVAAARRAELQRRADLLRRLGDPSDARLRVLAAAADAFIVRRRAAGQDLASVIAGYHWFGDWGRDALIALPGLALETGRPDAAGKVLAAFADAASEGMVPNCFAEETGRPLFNTVDASLWFLQAVAAYARAGGEGEILRDALWPAARQVVERYAAGTRFGIHADADGLIAAGSPDTQLTWMDARTSDGRPVTPRFGKAVEIQALWLSGLALVAEMAADLGQPPPAACAMRAKARDAFEALFWNDETACLFDCVFPDGRRDPAVRPNQVFAVGLPHAPLAGPRAKAVVRAVREKLLTPRGLRTLAPDDPAYKGRYEGGPDERDAAYHQGTVWPWLAGPYVDAVFAAEPARCARGEAAQVLAGLLDAMEEAGLGQISEVYDGDPPHRPGGCIAQAWSVAAAVHVWRRLEATGGVPQ